ncbi:MAG TPA: TonB-dependent receptor [Bryobacteraceae bacterium]|nr:TonB-dependent receptor [Bryobacteraceae bacterium]
MYKGIAHVLLGMAIVLSFATLVIGQETTGAILGVVRDNTDAVVPAAKVTAISEDTGAQFATETDATGSYQFPLLRAGRYRISVEHPGFQRMQRDGVIVNTTERVRVDITLKVGVVTETVTVTGEVPLLQSAQVTMGHVVEQRTITSIPLATRNFTQILGTSAGVIGAIYNADQPGTGSDSVSVNGMRRGSNNLLVDGAQTTNPLNMAPDGDGTPSIEFLSEFKVLTSLYSAEYGRNAGSVINVTTRSGTNEFHGSVYEFFRNTKLNARPFFNPTRGQNNQNQFGGHAGGKIIRDRTFFFAGWESSRQVNANSGSATLRTIVPTAAQRAGNFGSKTITDPTTGIPFQNNTIPADRLNPISLKLQEKYIPTPNFSSGATNFFAARGLPTDLNQYTVRIDHRFSEKDTIFGRWFDSRQKDFSPFTWGFPGFGNYANRKKYSLNVSETHLFSPTLIMETRFAYDQTDQYTVPENLDSFDSVGLKPLSVTRTDYGLPQFNINDYQTFGNYQNWSDYIKRFTGSASFTWLRSSHSVKFGYESVNALYNPKNTLDSRGRFFYTGEATGDSYADFLLSITRSKSFGAGAGELKMRDSVSSVYISDEWKVNQDLTLTLGLRHEAHFHPAAYNLGMTNWYPDRYKGVGSLEASGVVQGGVGGIPQSTINGDWNNFMPRVGAAWRLTDSWVIRAGAGLYFDQRSGQIAQQAFSNPPTFKSIAPDCSVAGSGCTLKEPDNFTFLDPQYDPQFIPFPTKVTDSLAWRGIERDTRTDNAWQWNFNIQRQLPKGFLVEGAYVGTKGTHLMARRNVNPLVPAGFDPNNPKTGTLTRRYPGFADILITAQNGDSIYHSAQFTVKRRIATGTMQIAYTIAKTLSNGAEGNRYFTSIYDTPWWDFSRARGPANYDRPQRFTAVFTQDLPKVGQSAVARHVLHNWSFNGFLVVQSGTPLTVTNRDSGRNLGGSAQETARALFSNVAADQPLVNSGSTKDNLKNYINKAAWSKAAVGTVGNSGRGMFRGPGQWNLDFSMFKDIPLTERFKLHFRSEFFNLLNHANFGDPTTNLDSSSFGQISSTAVNARLVQFALRLNF